MPREAIVSWPIALRVFVPFAAGYFLSYVYRTVNAVIAPDLRASLDLDAGALGLLTSAYFLAFAAFQLPLGLLLDRFGPRRVESALLLAAALGACIFALGDSAGTLVLGRACIGLGVSACLMAAFKAFASWFEKVRVPLANGCVMAAGGLGALTATAPVEVLLRVMDWRGLFLLLSSGTLVVAALIFFVVPERRDREAGFEERLPAQLRELGRVFASPLFWRIAPLATASQASFMAIQGLWTGPWLEDVAGLGRAQVAGHLLGIAASMIAGFVVLGVAAERLTRLGVRLVTVAGIGMVLYMLAQLAVVSGADAPPLVLWGPFGFFGTTGILLYAVLSQRFPVRVTGRVITSLNVLVFSGAFLAQWGLGTVIGRWTPSASGAYPMAAYQSAFGVMLALQVLTFLYFVWPRRRSAARFY
ncbi:MAG: MFS transporter [Gammaproteobacteria bacterium]|nr:MFS transporter [Gammaproteobacteria bacterium]